MSSSFAISFAFLVGINQLLILALSIPLEYGITFFQFSWKNVFTTFWHNTVVRHLYHSYGHFAFSHHHQCSIKKNTRIIKDGGSSKPEKDAAFATRYWGQNQSSQKWIHRETVINCLIFWEAHCDASHDDDANTTCSWLSCCTCRNVHLHRLCACSEYAKTEKRIINA